MSKKTRNNKMKNVILIGYGVLVGIGVIFAANPGPKWVDISTSIFSHSPLTTHHSPKTKKGGHDDVL
ncbi:MAG: hypothetical protein QG657_3842 [Acidobacteriota bacterium]|nr:hypothetical protein [Acidobacteriota bacterium]